MQDIYQSPFSGRYASRDMQSIFSSQFKHSTWRKLWLELAKAQRKLGLNISSIQIDEMERHLEDIDFDAVKEEEGKLRHDVMAHIHVFARQCPTAAPIIHLGATSCFVTDNSELIQIRQGLKLLKEKLATVIHQLSSFALKYAALPCLGFTHYQAAQLTTVGKRTCLWVQDFLFDLEDLDLELSRLAFLGVKGTTGTQASFLKLFDGDATKVEELDKLVQSAFAFEKLLPISGQTYTRKQDIRVLNALASFAASSHKFATDLRLLSNLKEVEEPFEKQQVGSSAMPYKRNPMRSERICALSRFLISLSENPKYTTALQWFERTLDDSANRRLAISEAFLAADSVMNLLMNVTDGLIVYPISIRKRVEEELPFMATENILMESVKRGGDRQVLHERLRLHSLAAGKKIKEEGASNDLMERIECDPSFPLKKSELQDLLTPEDYTGLAERQVRNFIAFTVNPSINNIPLFCVKEALVTV